MSDTEVKTTEDETWKNNEDGIRKMMDQWADGKLTDAQDTFNNIVGKKADDIIDTRKADVAASIFNQAIAPEGEVVDVTTDEPNEVEEPVEAEAETEEPETETEEENEDV